MFDPLLLPAALLHALVLLGVLLFACRRANLPWRDWPFVVYVLFWADLVLAGHLASFAQGLNKLEIYIPASLLALAGLLGLVYASRKAHAPPLLAPPCLQFAPITDPPVRKILFWFLGVTLGLAAMGSLVLAFIVYPDNADSMIYRLPRVFWYVSHGSFTHPFDGLDKRVMFYPLDGVALYVPLVLYNLPGVTHNFPSLLSWMILVAATYRFARALGAERLIALFATWIVALTPSILAQATSTNDELLCATALVAGLYMGWRWLVTGVSLYFVLAASAVGLSIGTKLHIVFLAPVLLAALGLAVGHIRRNPASLRLWVASLGARAGGLGLLMLVLMGGSFLAYNYVSSGRLYFLGDFAHDVFNLRGSLHGFLQNILIYTAQMTLSPIADLNFWPYANDRQMFNTALNAIFNPLIQPFIDTDPSNYHLGYRFVGVTLPTSVRFVEFSLWSGFVWLLWPLQARLALGQKKFPLRGLFFLLAITPPLWLLLWSASTLYMEGTATYFAFYLMCASPAAAFAFLPIRKATANEGRWAVLVFVALSNLLISTNLFMFSGFRALPDLVFARNWPVDWDLAEPTIINELRRADTIRIVFTHEKMPYFAYMHWHPNATYENPYPSKDAPVSNKTLQIYSTPSDYMFGFLPLKIRNKPTAGLTYLGTVRALGREVVFASGNGVAQRWPALSDYILPHVTLSLAGQGTYAIILEDAMPGLSPDDHLEFSYELTMNGTQIFRRDWSATPGFGVRIPTNPTTVPTTLTLKVRDPKTRKELTTATYPLASQGAWLPDTGEY